MLRALVLALLLANAVYFIWSQGGFGGVAGVPSADPTEGEREPQRLAAQVHPERIQILPPVVAAASAASAAASASAADAAASGASAAAEAAAPASAAASAPAG